VLVYIFDLIMNNRFGFGRRGAYRLQYKYMKLVESASGKDGELPAAETCALDEGEEDEHFDAVQFKSKGRKFLKKFKKASSKKVDVRKRLFISYSFVACDFVFNC